LDTTKIIGQARSMAQRFSGGIKRQMRLPVFDFDDFLDVYDLPANGLGLSQYRDHCRRTWYLMQFLRQAGVEPQAVAVGGQAFAQWARATGQDLSDGHGRAHAVGDFVNDPAHKPSQCQHVSPMASLAVGSALATISLLGESPDQPEVVGVALHLRDGQVLEVFNVLTCDHTPEQAWGMVSGFLDGRQPRRVFQDQTVRRPEFCPDCGELLCNVASSRDVEQALGPA